MGILDQANPKRNTEHVGCEELLMTIRRIKPKIHVFGHIHGGYGHYKMSFGTDCYNASSVDEIYNPVNPAWVVDLG